MSRATPTISRALAGSSRSVAAPVLLPRRFAGNDVSQAGSSMSGSTTSVDPRVLEGIPSFLPKANIDRVCEWQSGLWKRLAAEIRNNPELFEIKQKWDRTGLDISYLLSQTAKDTKSVVAFNYGSLLLNNSYFLEGLHGDSSPKEIPSYFKSLEDRVEAYAEGMVGGGWLWLVRTGSTHTEVDVVPSFAGGTLLVTQRTQRGREDIPVFGSPVTTEENSGAARPTSTEGQETASSSPFSIVGKPRAPVTRPRVSDVQNDRPIPVAVLNLYEHAYIGEKYGVWGRGQYARDWFKSLNWDKVMSRAAYVQ